MCVGYAHACAITADARVKCWGLCQSGQCGAETVEKLGDEFGEMGDALPPVNLGWPQPEVTSLACARDSTCALLSDGTVRCWGPVEHLNGQFEYSVQSGTTWNTMGVTLPPTQLPTGRKATSISCGREHCCFILDDGSAVCYGDNYYGELGDGGWNANLGSRNMGAGGPFGANDAGLVDLPPGRAAVKIACGYIHTCAILDEGSVVCWGDNGEGQLGNGRMGYVCHGWNDDTCGENLIPVNLGSGRRAIDIAAGHHWTCAVLDDGGVHCWGSNSNGVLGYDMTKFGSNLGDDPLEPGGVADPIYFPGGKAVKVYGTQYTRCVILDSGDVVCWGRSSPSGEVPNSHGASASDWTNPNHWSLQDDYPPIDLGGRKAFALAAGGGSENRFQCAMLSAADCDDCRDEIRCWGANDHGQLGYGNTRTRGIVDGDFARDVVDLGAIGVHPAFEVGVYYRAAEPTPPDAIEALTVSMHLTCAILASGRVLCWGRNDVGALGNFNHHSWDVVDPGSYKAVPVFFGYDERSGSRDKTFFAKSMSTNDGSMCAILEDDSLACWGENKHYSLGIGGFIGGRGRLDALTHDPNGITSRVPVLDRSGEPAKIVDSCQGHYFGCAATSEGDAWCWGQDRYGKLGLGSNSNPTNTNPPDDIGSPPTRVDLGAGENGAPLRAVALSCAAHAVCAVFDDGRAKCWGKNSYGELGFHPGSVSYVGNAVGEMGDALPFLYLGEGRRVLKLSAGYEHFCAVLDTHELKCWGNNYYGAIGAANVASRTLADVHGTPYYDNERDSIVDLGSDVFCRPLRVVDVAAMTRSTCAVFENGRVKCFGDNDSGRLGLGLSGNRGDNPGQMGNALNFVDLGDPEVWRVKRLARSSASAAHMCAVLVPVGTDSAASGAEPEKVKCWGSNGYGALGVGDTYSRGLYPDDMGDNLPFVEFASWARPAESGWTLATTPAPPGPVPLPEWAAADAPVVPTLDFSSLAIWNVSTELFIGSAHNTPHATFNKWTITSSESDTLPAWAVGAPGTMKTNYDHRYRIYASFTTSSPVVVRALVHPDRENNMNDHALYRDRPELEFDAEWWNGHYVAVKERLFPAGSHELIIVEKEFYLFFAPDPATPSCYPQPADLPRASVSNVTRVDFLGKSGVVPWLPESDSPLLWTGARPLPAWSSGALGTTFDAYSRDVEYFHATAATVVRVVARSRLELTDFSNWTRREDLDWTYEGDATTYEPTNIVYERVFEAGTHALDTRSDAFQVSDNFWYQFFQPADASGDAGSPQPVLLASARL